MAKDKWDKNKKSPNDPVSESTIEPMYGWWYGESNPLGGHKFFYANPKKKDEYYHQELTAHGTYKAHGYDDKEKGFNVGLNVGGVRKYNTASVSHQTDGQMQSDVEKNELTQTGADGGIVHKGDHYNGVGGNRIQGEGGNKLSFTQGGSSVVNYNVVNGKSGTMYDDHVHHSFNGDEVKLNKKGNKLTIMQKGDVGVDVQKGNWDTNVASKARINSGGSMLYSTGDTFTGTAKKKMTMSTQDEMSQTSQKAFSVESKDKYNVKASSDITIESESKITLKVGGSSIEISSGDIKIKASGSVDIQGSSTKIQGGGPTTWQIAGTPLTSATFQ